MSSELHHTAPQFVEAPVPHPVDLRVGIVGAGKLGMTLALALEKLGVLAWIVAPSAQRRRELRAAFPHTVLYASVNELHSLPDLTILSVRDSAIEDVATELSRKLAVGMEGKYLMHCSGALAVSVLDGCKRWGARTIAAHPFETFAYPSERALIGIAWGIECEAEDEEFAKTFVRMLRGTPVMLPEHARAHKALYHIAAVVASNYLNALIASARDVALTAQVQPEVFLPPIIRTTVENALLSLAHGSSPQLTGPIARADVETIGLHLEALRAQPSLFTQYCYLGLATTEFARSENTISDEQYRNIKEVFDDALASQQVG